MSRLSFTLLLLLACLQILGVALGRAELIGLGAASAASPAPKVFTSNQGLEAFSSRYLLVLERHDGTRRKLTLTRDGYASLAGPYNRRNPYGAVFAFAPLLYSDPRTRDAFVQIAQFGLCGSAPVLRELGLTAADYTPLRVLVQIPRTATQSALPLSVEVRCP